MYANPYNHGVKFAVWFNKTRRILSEFWQNYSQSRVILLDKNQPDESISPDKGFLTPAYNTPISLPESELSSFIISLNHKLRKLFHFVRGWQSQTIRRKQFVAQNIWAIKDIIELFQLINWCCRYKYWRQDITYCCKYLDRWK